MTEFSMSELSLETGEMLPSREALSFFSWANVNAYNTRIQLFPNSIVAGNKFSPRELFQLDSPAERAVPAVAF